MAIQETNKLPSATFRTIHGNLVPVQSNAEYQTIREEEQKGNMTIIFGAYKAVAMQFRSLPSVPHSRAALTALN